MGASSRTGLGSAEAPEPSGLGPTGAIPSARFTPGPWDTNVKRLSDNSICVAHVVSAGKVSVAQLATHGEEETVANAHLIAAAPEIVDALEWALAEITGHAKYNAPEQHQNCLSKATAALAKARGEVA